MPGPSVDFEPINFKDSKYGNCLRDFKIISLLGKGSFGSVYKVLSLHTRQTYVMKKISTLSTLKVSYQNAAVREVTLLKSLDNPHVVKLMTSFVEKDCLYIIMEYAQSGDIHSFITKQKDSKKRLKETELWSMLHELLLGIQHLHENNVIHRDLKPLNLFLNSKRCIKIGDLGVAKKIIDDNEDDKNYQICDSKVGTPLFLAPELVQNYKYDFKVDIWAIGVTMYYLTVLFPPFAGDNLNQLSNNILNTSPKDLPKYYTNRYKSLILSFLSKNPSERPTAAEALEKVPDLIKTAYISQFRFNEVKDKEGSISSRDSAKKLSELPLTVIPIPMYKKSVKMTAERLARP